MRAPEQGTWEAVFARIDAARGRMIRGLLDPPRFTIALAGGLLMLAWLAAPDRQPAALPETGIAAVEQAAKAGIGPSPGQNYAVLAESPAESPAKPADAEEDSDAPARVGQELENLPRTAQALALEPLPPGSRIARLTVTARRGDTLARLLLDAGVGRAEAQGVVDSLAGVFKPRELRPGHEIQLSFLPDAAASSAEKPLGRLEAVHLAATIDREVAVRAAPGGGFKAESIVKQVNRSLTRADGEITGGSLMVAGTQAGVPAGMMIELIKILSFDVDFQRDIQPGDRFDLLYERFQLADGRLVRGGEVQYVSLSLGGKKLTLYRHKDARGFVDYYNGLGHSVRKALLKTPIDGARLSSRFGMREHPILGYTTLHRGVDFAAPAGTPIYAAGDGTIEDIGERNGYGRYVRVKHGNSYATAYAHMNAFGRGLKPGSRVRQGQVIGYVGATGRATGPHLHYEVLRNGDQINPVAVKFPSGEKLAGAELTRFRAVKANVDRVLSGTPEQQASSEPHLRPGGAR